MKCRVSAHKPVIFENCSASPWYSAACSAGHYLQPFVSIAQHRIWCCEQGDITMRKITMTLLTLLLALLPLASAHGQAAQQSFAFNAKNISGFPTGAALLTGGGSY